MKQRSIKTKFTRLRIGLIVGIVTICARSVAQAALDLFPGDSESYAVLYEGKGNNSLQINSSPAASGFTIDGNVGLANLGSPPGTPTFQFNNPAVIRGNVNFANSTTSSWHPAGGVLIGNTNFGVASVAADMTAINMLSSNLGTLSGTPLVISGNTTVLATTGVFNSTYGAYVFTLSSLSLGNGQTLTIDGQNSDANVIINFNSTSGLHFAGAISLTGGLTPDNAIMNLYGGNFSTLSGGPTLQTAANGAEQDITYLNPNGNIGVNSVNIVGHLFGGDSANMSIVSGSRVQLVPEPGITALAGFGGLSMILLGRRLCRLTRSS